MKYKNVEFVKSNLSTVLLIKYNFGVGSWRIVYKSEKSELLLSNRFAFNQKILTW